MSRRTFTEADISLARQLFVEQGYSFTQMAQQSEQLFGREISRYALMDMEKADPMGAWSTQRARRSVAAGLDISGEIDAIRQALYAEIVASSRTGLHVTGPYQLEEVQAVLNEHFPELHVELAAARGLDSALVNAYMSVVQKGNYKVSAANSKKTSIQQILEAVRE